ncbi:hypothetical protein CRG98_046599 [Punica granatum]|uniref:Uncharacterized protein n=1 Tax=Punica granatum TaxID=22663 RepID=A0A2I0HMP1_PUNGR|nr:hypothetical protein CRG98_046599 [Punica granatum]
MEGTGGPTLCDGGPTVTAAIQARLPLTSRTTGDLVWAAVIGIRSESGGGRLSEMGPIATGHMDTLFHF